jgi:hypothetical protein
LQKWVKKHGVNRSEAQVPQEPRAQRETPDLRDHRDQHVLIPAVAQQPQWESKHYGGGKGGRDTALAQRPTGGKAQSPKETLQKWTWMKKHEANRSEAQVPQEPRAQRETQDLRNHRDQHVLVPAVAQQPQWESKHYGGGKGGRDTALAQRPTGGKAGGKGKGLSHFERIQVDIDDDESFRVVQRLIGPRGKHVQDITMQCYGSKVWIIGRGSRSWEDDLGPLMICVGATTRPVFDSAVNLIQELLVRVREDHKLFLRQ